MTLSRRQFLLGAALVAAGARLSRPARAKSPIYCPVLMYHYISYPPDNANATLQDLVVAPELFSEHLTALQEDGFTPITMAALWAGLSQDAELPEKPVILTFDDGYDDAYGQAAPRILERGMTGTFFIITGKMDQPGHLTWGQAAEMKSAGLEIGNHTINHPNLTSLSSAAQYDEIDGAAAAIETALGERPRAFCYPLGRYNNETVRILRETGHHTATTTSDGTLHYATNPFRMSRVRIRNTTKVDTLRWLLNRQA